VAATNALGFSGWSRGFIETTHCTADATVLHDPNRRITTSYTANMFEVIFTVFNCVPISTVVLLYGLHLIAAPSAVE
jgi:hypothetical protein